MNVEVQVELDKFSLRWYQEEIWDTIEEGRSKRILYIASRRAGKDILFWNLAIRQCIKKTCLVFYVLPTYSQGRRAVFDAISIDGTKFLDYLPRQLIKSINQAEMKVTFHNSSILQIIGGDTYDTSLIGTNPYAVILSEYALMPADIFSFIRPILAANNGWCAVLGTPRGKNHLWQMWKVVQELPEWKVFNHKASEIHHIPDDVLAQERAQMDEGLYLQEYETSFERGIQGSWYGTHLDALKLKGQITHVPWEPGLLTYTSWDIGVNDATSIIWFNSVGDGSVIRIIDCYSNNNLGLDHYVNIINSKPYVYGKHFAPHDIKVREWGGGAITRYEKARQLGITFTVLDQIGVIEGIENVWTHFNKFWIDADNCRSLINALENYRKEWDDKRQMYLPRPVKSWANHYCFTADTLVLTRSGMRPIIDIRDNEYVLTRVGWKQCTKSFMTRKDANLVGVRFNDGTMVKCTPDHMFLTRVGWKSAEALEKGSEILLSSIYGHSISEEMCIGSTKVKNTSRALTSDYIEKSGPQHLEMYPKDVIFTMSMEIAPITVSSTSFAYLKKNIELFQNQITKALEKIAERQQPNGTDHLKESSGTNNKPLEVSHGKSGDENYENVNSVAKISNVSLEVMVSPESIAMRTVKQLRVVSVEPLNYTEDVYCISVPGVGHFSLANGAIVKNCDALRYLCMSLHKTKRGMSPEEFDRKKAQALYGNNQADLPRFFRSDSRYDSYR